MATIDDLRAANPWAKDLSDLDLVKYRSDFLGIPMDDVARAFGVNFHQNKGLMGDIGTALKQGVEMLPGAALGMAEIPWAIATGERPLTDMANAVGNATGFQPSRWSREANYEYSPQQQAAAQAVQRAWESPEGWSAGVSETLMQPRYAATLVGQNLPNIVAGGLVGRAISSLSRGTTLTAEELNALRAAGLTEQDALQLAQQAIAPRIAPIPAAAIGEGVVTAGQNYDQTDPSANPRLAALAALAGGTITAGIGYGAGQLANRLGLTDIETMLAGQKTAGSLPWWKRIPGGMIEEGVLQELPQSYQEQVWQNLAEGKPWNEGAARQGFEGMLVGGLSGGAVNVPGSFRTGLQQTPATDLPLNPPIDNSGRTPSNLLAPDPYEAARRAQRGAMAPLPNLARLQQDTADQVGLYTDLLNAPAPTAPAGPTLMPELPFPERTGSAQARQLEFGPDGQLRIVDARSQPEVAADAARRQESGGLLSSYEVALLNAQRADEAHAASQPTESVASVFQSKAEALAAVSGALEAGHITPEQHKQIVDSVNRNTSHIEIARRLSAALQAKENANGGTNASQRIPAGNGNNEVVGAPAAPVVGVAPSQQQGRVGGQNAQDAANAENAQDAQGGLGVAAAQVNVPTPAPKGKVTLSQPDIDHLARTAVLGRTAVSGLVPDARIQQLAPVASLIAQVQDAYRAMNSLLKNRIIPAAVKDKQGNVHEGGYAKANAASLRTIDPRTKLPYFDAAWNAGEAARARVVAGLTALQQAVGAQTVEAIAARAKQVKDLNPRTSKAEGETMSPAEREAGGDINFSAPWAAFKAGQLQNLTSFVNSREHRYSVEEQARLRGLPDSDKSKWVTDYNAAVEKHAKGQPAKDGKAAVRALPEAKAHTRAVLDMIANVRQTGTALEAALAGMLHRTLTKAYEAGTTKLRIQWGSKAEIEKQAGKQGVYGFYNGATDTLHLAFNTPKEIALHEMLHAGLTWFIHKNPAHAAVIRLANAWKRIQTADVGNFIGTTAQVVQAIQDTSGGPQVAGTGVTANQVSELASYALTNSDFQRTLMSGKPEFSTSAETALTPAERSTIVKAWSALWEGFTNLMRAFFGGLGSAQAQVSANLMSDIAENTAMLLHDAAEGAAARGPTETTNFAYIGTSATTQSKSLAEDREIAQKLKEKGASDEKIRLATGWFQNPHDGEWRREISDRKAKLTRPMPGKEGTAPVENALVESPVFGKETTYKLSEVLDHPLLYKMYPEAKNIDFLVRKGVFDFGGLQGWFDPEKNKIGVTPYASDPRGTLLHEVQHWIQQKEGFATGGNADSVVESLTEEQRQRIAERLIEKARTAERDAQSAVQAAQRVKAAKKGFFSKDAIEVAVAAQKDSQRLFSQYQADKSEANHAAWMAAYEAANKADDALREVMFGQSKWLKLSDAEQVQFLKAKQEGSAAAYLEKARADFVEARKALAAITSGDPEALTAAIKKSGETHNLYLAIAGEIEARDVAERQNLSLKERAATPPLSSSKIAPEDVIVTKGEKGPSTSQLTPEEEDAANKAAFAAADAKKAYYAWVAQPAVKDLVDINVDHENTRGYYPENSEAYWKGMLASAQDAVQFRAEERGIKLPKTVFETAPNPDLHFASVVSTVAVQGSPVDYLNEAIKEPLTMERFAASPSLMEGLFRGMGWERVVASTEAKFKNLGAAYAKAFPLGAAINDWFAWGWSASQIRDKVEELNRLARAPVGAANAFAKLLDRMDPGTQQRMLDALDSRQYAGLSAHEESVVRNFDQALKRLLGIVSPMLSGLDRSRLATAKPSELLFYVTKYEDRATAGFTADTRKLPLAGREAAVVDAQEVYTHLVNGVAAYQGQRFRAVTADNPAKPGERHVVAMVNEHQMANQPLNQAQNEQFDQSRVYFFDGKGSKAGDLKFVSNLPYTEALKVNKETTHAHAVRNTVDRLSKLASGVMIADAVAEDGLQSGQVFNSVADLEAALPGAKDRVVPLDTLNRQGRTNRFLMRSPITWVAVPATSKRFGAMAGKVINGSVWAMLEDMHHTSQPAWAPLNVAMSVFKASKTIYSPGTHLINAGTNIAWMYLHDIPLTALSKGFQIYADAHLRPESLSAEDRAIWSAFTNSGALLDDYSTAEIKAAMDSAARMTISKGMWGMLGKIGSIVRYQQVVESKVFKGLKRGTQAVHDTATGLYSAEDNVFRLAAFMSEVGKIQQLKKGQPITEGDLALAGRHAKQAFLDYNIHARGINQLKGTVIPFISWPYRAIPLLAKMALEKPWKIAPMLGAFYVLEAMLAAAGGGDDEEKRKLLPAYMNQRMYGFGPHMYMQVPMLGSPDRPVYFKFGAFAPAGDLIQDDGKKGFMGLDWWPQAITPNGPIITAIAGTVLGIDSFTGQKIERPTDDSWMAFKARSVWMAQQMTPPLATEVGKTIDNVARDKMNLAGNKAMDNDVALMRAVGLRLAQVDTADRVRQQVRIEKAITNDFRQEAGRIKKEMLKYPDYDPDELQQRLDALKERMVVKLNRELNREEAPDDGED